MHYSCLNNIPFKIAGLPFPTNHVSDQGSACVNSFLQRGVGDESVVQAGLPGSAIFSVFHGVNKFVQLHYFTKPDQLTMLNSTIYYSYEDIAKQPADRKECVKWAMSRKATLELTQ